MKHELFAGSPTNVPVLERPAPPKRASTDAPELARIKSALDAIPNSGTKELDYDAWRNIIFAVSYATDRSDAGLSLAHEFSSRSSKYDADFLDNRVWPYIQNDRGGTVITERTLFNAAEKEGWQDPAALDDFEVVQPAAAPQDGASTEKPSRFRVLLPGEFKQRKPLTWIIRDVLPAAELVVMYGESGSGKSFCILDMIGAISRGVDWRGKRTKKGRCVYIAAEGAGGFLNRLKAYAIKNEIDLDALEIGTVPDAPNFMLKEDIVDLVNSVRAFGKVDVVVVDTLARVMPGANENAGEDLGRVIEHCKTIHIVTGAVVVLIHHSGKDASKGARGHSSLKAAADAEIEIVRSDNDRVLTVTKMKDGEDGAEFGFRLNVVPVDLDDDNEVVSSCTVEYTDAIPKSKRKSKAEPKGTLESLVLAVAREMQGLDGAGPSANELLVKVVAEMPDTRASEDARDTRRQRAAVALDRLCANGVLVAREGLIGFPAGDEE